MAPRTCATTKTVRVAAGQEKSGALELLGSVDRRGLCAAFGTARYPAQDSQSISRSRVRRRTRAGEARMLGASRLQEFQCGV
jgi:hypothetical protein